MWRPFEQVDVFTNRPYAGNPVAVVLDAAGLEPDTMQRFAAWTNLSETTFVLPATTDEADYRLRIFTPAEELPFAGHPTLGSAHAWLSHRGQPHTGPAHPTDQPPYGDVVQECGAGLVRLRQADGRLGFAAPPLVRSGPVDPSLVRQLTQVLGVEPDDVLDTQWVDNGPGWVGVLLRDADAVLRLRPGPTDLPVGVVGPHPDGQETAFEVRAFFPIGTTTVEDPVTGSLNASLAGWLLATGRARSPYVASQGTNLGRAGRVHVSAEQDGTVWVAGDTTTRITGEVDL